MRSARMGKRPPASKRSPSPSSLTFLFLSLFLFFLVFPFLVILGAGAGGDAFRSLADPLLPTAVQPIMLRWLQLVIIVTLVICNQEDVTRFLPSACGVSGNRWEGGRKQKENTISMLYLTECDLSSSFPNLGFRFAMEINRSRTQVCLGGSFVATVLTCCISPRSRCRSRAPLRAPGPYRTGPAGPPVPDQGQFPPVCFVRADRASAYRFRPGWLPLHSGRVIRLQTEQVNEKGIS